MGWNRWATGSGGAVDPDAGIEVSFVVKYSGTALDPESGLRGFSTYTLWPTITGSTATRFITKCSTNWGSSAAAASMNILFPLVTVETPGEDFLFWFVDDANDPHGPFNVTADGTVTLYPLLTWGTGTGTLGSETVTTYFASTTLEYPKYTVTSGQILRGVFPVSAVLNGQDDATFDWHVLDTSADTFVDTNWTNIHFNVPNPVDSGYGVWQPLRMTLVDSGPLPNTASAVTFDSGEPVTGFITFSDRPVVVFGGDVESGAEINVDVSLGGLLAIATPSGGIPPFTYSWQYSWDGLERANTATAVLPITCDEYLNSPFEIVLQITDSAGVPTTWGWGVTRITVSDAMGTCP